MKSEEKWHSLVENVPDIIMVVDRDGTIQFINHTVSGITSEQVTGKTIYDYISSEYHEITKKYLEQVFQTGIGSDYELIGAGPHGTTSWYWTTVGPIKHQGQVVAASIITRDITKNKRAQEALRRQAYRAETIIQTSIDGFCMVSVDGKIMMVNSAFCDITGYSKEELLGMKITGIEAMETAEQTAHHIDKVINVGYDRFETKHQRKDGRIIDIEVNSQFCNFEQEKFFFSFFRDITKRKKAEKEIKKFKTISDRAGYGVKISNLKGNLIYINESCAKIHGYTSDELIGKNLSIFHNKEQMENVNRLNKQLTEKGSFVAEEVWHRRKDGTIFCALMNGTLIRDEKGEPLFLASAAIDISEHKRADEALRESQHRQMAILNSIPDMAWLKDKDSRYIAANETFCRSFCIKLEDLVGKTDFDISPEDLAQKYRADDQKVVKSGRQMRIEEPWASKGDAGERMYLETIKTPIRNEKREIIGTSGIARDITERKKAEEALQQSEIKYRTLLENIPQKIFLKDKNSVYISCNENYAKDLNIKAEEISGKTDYDDYPRELAEKYRADDKKIIESGETQDIEEKYIQDGQERIVHTIKTPVKNEQGNVTGILGIFRDITKLKQTEEELDMYREKMVRAEQMASLGTLSATMAHELTQPLTVVNLSIENSLAELEKTICPDDVIKGLKDGLSELSNVTSIVDRFRNFARQSSEKIAAKVNLKVLAERITMLLNESARRAKLTFRLKGLDKLPLIYSNEKDLEQLFFALIDNAIQEADGKRNHQLTISGTVKDKYIELRFSDDCGGIAPENIDKIFEPFFTTRPAGEGTGLGLCVVQRIVTEAGGKVSVKSKPGKGSTFFITLPINRDRML